MKQHNPAHPGELIMDSFINSQELTGRELARRLDVAPGTINRVLQTKASITPDMAIRLSKVLGIAPETWLSMQSKYDLWHTLKNNNYKTIERMALNRASNG